MNSLSRCRTLFPATPTLSDAEKIKLLREIERESGIYILANVCAVWLLVFLVTEKIADFLSIEFFRSIGGWALIVVAAVVSTLVSMGTHKRLMAYLIAKKFNAA